MILGNSVNQVPLRIDPSGKAEGCGANLFSELRKVHSVKGFLEKYSRTLDSIQEELIFDPFRLFTPLFR